MRPLNTTSLGTVVNYNRSANETFKYSKTIEWWLHCTNAVSEWLASRLVSQWMAGVAWIRASNMSVPSKNTRAML